MNIRQAESTLYQAPPTQQKQKLRISSKVKISLYKHWIIGGEITSGNHAKLANQHPCYQNIYSRSLVRIILITIPVEFEQKMVWNWS